MSKSEDSFEKNPQKKINYALAGAASGIMTRALCQPLDVIKIRFQLQLEPISKKHEVSKYQSVGQAIRVITKEEGIFGLWRGHVTAQLLSISYGLVQVYELLKIEFSKLERNYRGFDKENPVISFICGGTAGSLATFCSFPFDIVRTRLIAQGNNKHYTSILHGLEQIYFKEGVQAYWRGLTPALIVSGPFIGFQFTFYELSKKAILYFDWHGVEKNKTQINALGNFIAGCIAGVFSKCITYPFDLARKRMQMQNFQHARVGFGQNFWCDGLICCFRNIFHQERIAGLFKGLWPSMIKSALTTALHFTFYAESLKIINRFN